MGTSLRHSVVALGVGFRVLLTESSLFIGLVFCVLYFLLVVDSLIVSNCSIDCHHSSDLSSENIYCTFIYSLLSCAEWDVTLYSLTRYSVF